MRWMSLLSVFALSLPLAGCATIVSGTRENVVVTSTPAGALVHIQTTGGFTVFEGRTPAALQMARDREYVATVSVPGYQDARVAITRDFNAWTLGNIFCGVVPLIVDVLTGAYMNLSPNEIVVTLAPLPPGAYADGPKNRDGEEASLAVVLARKDDDGNLRFLSVPLTKVAAADAPTAIR